MMWDLKMSHENMSDFVSFPLFGFTLVIKLRNFDFESHWNTLLLLLLLLLSLLLLLLLLLLFWSKKNDARFEYALPDSVWFGLSFVVWEDFGQ